MEIFYHGTIWFNRYIVECKFYKWDDISSVKIRFNRYIVECKFKRLRNKVDSKSDLIDT